jgi:predicted RNase H-like HicB family nuclease
MRYAFPCNIEGNEDDRDGFVATYPDVRGAITGGKTFRDSIILAEDCLVVALASYVDCQEELPTPNAWEKGQEFLTVQPLIAAQLNLYVAMREQGVTASDLERRLNIAEDEVKRLLSLDYKTSINEVVEALELLGCKPAVEGLMA